MIIHIHDNLLVEDMKERFEKCFQCLKIEFYILRIITLYTSIYIIELTFVIPKIHTDACNQLCFC